MTYNRYYDFFMGSEKAGYFEIKDDGNVLTMNAIFKMNGQVHVNPFSVRHVGNKILAFRAHEGQWNNSESLSNNQYPSSAWPFLLPQVSNSLSYELINDVDAKVIEMRVLIRQGNIITESADGKTTRTFILDGEIPIEINWGGPAKSHLKQSCEEALAGSNLETDKDFQGFQK